MAIRLETLENIASAESKTVGSKFQVDSSIHSLRESLHSERVPHNIYYAQIGPLRKLARRMNKLGRG